jgi:hypothetical protein
MVVDLGTFYVCHEDSPASNGGMPSSHKARPSRFRRFLVRQRFLCYVCVCGSPSLYTQGTHLPSIARNVPRHGGTCHSCPHLPSIAIGRGSTTTRSPGLIITSVKILRGCPSSYENGIGSVIWKTCHAEMTQRTTAVLFFFFLFNKGVSSSCAYPMLKEAGAKSE